MFVEVFTAVKGDEAGWPGVDDETTMEGVTEGSNCVQTRKKSQKDTPKTGPRSTILFFYFDVD